MGVYIAIGCLIYANVCNSFLVGEFPEFPEFSVPLGVICLTQHHPGPIRRLQCCSYVNPLMNVLYQNAPFPCTAALKESVGMNTRWSLQNTYGGME